MKQADILPGFPDALSGIPPKAREYQGLTLDEAIVKAHALVDEALDHCNPEHVLLAYSGGEDSVILAHLMRERSDAIVHVNTGIAIPDTLRHVRAVTGAWKRELIEASPDCTYEDLILGNVLNKEGPSAGEPAWKGFPGPAAHDKMYQRLKERALDGVRRMLVGRRGRKRGRGGEIVQMAGMRWAESKRRFRNASEFDPDGATTWVSPLVWWTGGHMKEYRARYRCQLVHDHADNRLCTPGALPLNEVTQHLHMSGDCLCGAFAKEGEIHGLELFYPDMAGRLHELEARALAKGDIPPQRCKWGWGTGLEVPSASGRMCARCVPPQIPGQLALDGPQAGAA